MLDWNVARSNICLAHLPKAENQELVLKLIHELTYDVVEAALRAKAPGARLCAPREAPWTGGQAAQMGKHLKVRGQ